VSWANTDRHNVDCLKAALTKRAWFPITEREVMSSINALPEDKAVLMIAHRLSTVKRRVRIIVLDKGQLVGCANGGESGNSAHRPAWRRSVTPDLALRLIT